MLGCAVSQVNEEGTKRENEEGKLGVTFKRADLVSDPNRGQEDPRGSVVVHRIHRSPQSKTQSAERSGDNQRLLTGQSFVIFLLDGSCAVVKRQHGGACRGAAMHGGFFHCPADGDTFPEDDVLPPVPGG